jgi:hypothetical protein
MLKELVSCPRNSRYVAGVQLAVLQGASEAPISESYGAGEQREELANWPGPKGGAMKMGRRPRCSSVIYQCRYAPSYRRSGSERLSGVHFHRNNRTAIPGTGHQN